MPRSVRIHVVPFYRLEFIENDNLFLPMLVTIMRKQDARYSRTALRSIPKNTAPLEKTFKKVGRSRCTPELPVFSNPDETHLLPTRQIQLVATRWECML